MAKLEIEADVLRCVFDAAVNSLDFGSGFLDDEEVEALRAIAGALGIDPMTGTPEKFKCKYGVPHEPSWWNMRAGTCMRCGRKVFVGDEAIAAAADAAQAVKNAVPIDQPTSLALPKVQARWLEVFLERGGTVLK